MDGSSALALLSGRGLTVRVEGGRLKVRPAERLDDDLRELLRRDRAALVELLSSPAPSSPAPPPEADHEPDTEARIWGDWLRSLAAAGHVERLLGGYPEGIARRLLDLAEPTALDVESMRELTLACETLRWPERYQAAGLPMPGLDPLTEAVKRLQCEGGTGP